MHASTAQHCLTTRGAITYCLGYSLSNFYFVSNSRLSLNVLASSTALQDLSVRQDRSTNFALTVALPAIRSDFMRYRDLSRLRCGVILQVHLGSMALE
jgi:hypothetical protein